MQQEENKDLRKTIILHSKLLSEKNKLCIKNKAIIGQCKILHKQYNIVYSSEVVNDIYMKKTNILT